MHSTIPGNLRSRFGPPKSRNGRLPSSFRQSTIHLGISADDLLGRKASRTPAGPVDPPKSSSTPSPNSHAINRSSSFPSSNPLSGNTSRPTARSDLAPDGPQRHYPRRGRHHPHRRQKCGVGLATFDDFNGFPIVQPSRNAAEVIAQVRGSDGVHDILIDHRTSTLQEILWVHDFSLPG